MGNRKLIRMSTNQTNFVTKRIFWDKRGYLDFEYTPVFIKLIRKVSCFYDIGANIGYYSLIAASENPSIRIRCFEPAEGPLSFLNENVKLNGFTNIHVESLALSDHLGEIDFYEVKNTKYTYLKYNLGGEGNAGSKANEGEYLITKIRATTLDEYFKSIDDDKIDLIKIDTEGTEIGILRNASFVIETMKPIVICETLFNRIEAELEELFISHGYFFYHFNGKGLRKVNTIKRQSDDGIRDCFFVHPEKLHLISDLIIN
jgi:FkbM family methyltransferase